MKANSEIDPDGMVFDGYYASVRGRAPEAIPWAHGAPHPMFAPWLAQAKPPKKTANQALIVGSGLGDDAEAVAALGWHVTAFDISEHAITWARERFPDSLVDYQVANLFDLSPGWRQRFDLVIEIYTVQALPVTRRQRTIAAISDLVGANGELVIVALTRSVQVPLRGRPWQLTDAELESFKRYGLVEIGRQLDQPKSQEGPGLVRLSLQRRDRRDD